jgi:ankyrin repeat protein
MSNIEQICLTKKDKKLFELIKLGSIKKCRRILQKGAHIHCINSNNYTPLLYAISQNNINIMRLLLSKGANIHNKTNYGMSSILLASSCANLEIVIFLLESGANINDISQYGYAPIHIACISNNIDIVEHCLKNGAHIYIKHNETPILLCAFYGRKTIIQLLLSYGSNINDKNEIGENAMDILYKKKHYECIDTIKRWPTTMFIIIFIELNIYNMLDLSLICDIYEYSNTIF